MEMMWHMAEKVVITKSLLDDLANDINEASGESGAKTIAQMRNTVQNLSVGGGYYTPTVTQMDENTMKVEYAASSENMPIVEPVTVALPQGPQGEKGATGATGTAGPTGATGAQGPKGDKGDTGATGATGSPGKDGYTPVKGTDYWTEADKQEILDEDILYLSQELAKRQQLTPEYANDISGCTDTSKLYVLPDGFIYAYILGESTGTKTETVSPVWQLGVKLDKSTGAESSGGQYTACEPIYIADGENLCVFRCQ